MAVYHVYFKHEGSDLDTVTQPVSSWGNCWASLQFQDRNFNKPAPDTEYIELNIIASFGAPRMVELVVQSEWFKRLTGGSVICMPEVTAANGTNFADSYGSRISTAGKIHFRCNGMHSAAGLVTGFRLLNQTNGIPQVIQDDPTLTPEQAALAMLYAAAEYGSSYYSDGSPAMFSPTGADVHAYWKEFGDCDREDFYYEQLSSWASIRSGYTFRDDYNLTRNPLTTVDVESMDTSDRYISIDQVLELFNRSAEQMRAQERGKEPLLIYGYLKDYEYLNDEECEIPDDEDFKLTINGALVVDVKDARSKRLTRLTQDRWAEVKHFAHIN